MQLPQIILRELCEIESPNYLQVKELRRTLNLNTQQAGDLIGVSKRTWERYENGTLMLSTSRWLYLSLIAGLNPKIKILSFGE